MADEVPETAGAATRNLLGAVGFILILLGGELLLEKTGDRFPLGIGLVIGGAPIFFAGVFWKWLQRRLATGISTKLNLVATDPRWWVVLLFLFIGVSHAQLSYSSSHWDAGGAFSSWIWLALVALAILYVLMTWRRIGILDGRPSVVSNAVPQSSPATERDLLLLLDFAVYQTTSELLDSLIKAAPQRILTEPLVLAAERYEEATKYLQQVRSKLAGSHRMSDMAAQLHDGEWQAKQQIRETPPEQRAAGIDPLDLITWAIANRQCWLMHQYLIRQLAEVKERIAAQRAGLVERFSLRSPP